MTAEKTNKRSATLKFDWVRAVRADRRLGVSVKSFAAHLCDSCINKKTFQFFHSPKTLASDLGVSVRSIERYRKELVENGYLVKVEGGGKKHLYEIKMRDEVARLSYDNTVANSASGLSQNHDKSVAPYKNQRSNQSTIGQNAKVFRTVTLTLEEAQNEEWRREWNRFLEAQGLGRIEPMLGLLMKGDRFEFPCRYPPQETDRRSFESALVYFKHARCPMV